MLQQLPVLADLHKVRPAIYWTDLLLSAGVGWTSFAIAAYQELGSPAGAVAIIVAIFALYRALAFTHEINHQGQRIPGFEAAWNWLMGFPLLLPSFAYAEVHFDHHRVATYGTEADPEYLPFARSATMMAGYCLHTLFIPPLLCLRFLVLAPIAFLSRPLERALVEHSSAIAINRHYRRNATDRLIRVVRCDSLRLLTFWTVLIALGVLGVIPIRAVANWFVVTTSIFFIDGLRTLAAHAYESQGQPMDKVGQASDSFDIPGRIWTELWAPVGLRYHATHHCFPGIPYHALPRAYRRLTQAMPNAHRKMTRPSLLRTLRDLYRKGLRFRRSERAIYDDR